jgi:CubicO group peptidase (beta-lactamase class C family)
LNRPVFCSRRRVAVPRDLGAVSRTDHAAECDPREAGMSEAGVAAVWSAVERLYRSGLHPAMTLVLRRHGRIVMKRSIGRASGNLPGESGPQTALHPDSPLCLFSASKSISALLVHKLADQGKLSLQDRVADYIPEFAAHGKGRVTIRQLLAHRAGIPELPVRDPPPEILRDWDGIVNMLCQAPPFDPDFGKQAYHALTCGYIVGELVRRVGRIELRQALHDWIAAPLNCRYLQYGMPPAQRALLPRNAGTGMRPVWPLTTYVRHAVGVSFDQAVELSNHEAFLSEVVPAGNICASADDACRVFQMLLNGGELDGVRVLGETTVADAVRPLGPIQYDRTLLLPLRFSAGFMLGENPFGLYGPKCGSAFGHLGFVSVLCWADPARDISVALLNTGKSMAPSGVIRLGRVLGAIAKACPQV